MRPRLPRLLNIPRLPMLLNDGIETTEPPPPGGVACWSGEPPGPVTGTV